MVKVLFLDTETTGLPKQPCYDYYYDPNQIGHYDSSRVVQIAALVYEIESDAKTGEVSASLLHEHDYLIKPDGFLIQNSHIHSITQSLATFAGITIKDAMDKIVPDLKDVHLMVAHNLGFDKNVLLSELYRNELPEYAQVVASMSEFCTSKGCTNLTKIPFNSKKFKQPKLIELYKFLFGEEVSGLHDALQDTRVMVKCFIELIKRKYISIEVKTE
jgi:DNA polymerase III epsilon subunit-like protein